MKKWIVALLAVVMLFCLVGCNQAEKEPAGTNAPTVSTQEATEPQETEPATKPEETEPKETEPKETEPAQTKPAEPTTPSHTHSWKEATCTTPKTCSECKATEGKAKGHNWKAATCTAAKTCSACKATEGKALGHTWKTATCTAPKTCSACKATEGKANGHKTGEWIVDKEATCTVNGSKHQACTVCNATVKTETIKAEHKPGQWVTDADATCDQEGSKHQDCSVCAVTVKTEKIPATGHDYKETVNGPTDDANAYIQYDCNTCGHSYTKEVAPISISVSLNSISTIVGSWGGGTYYGYSVHASGGYGAKQYKFYSGSNILQDWSSSNSIEVSGWGKLTVAVKDEIGQIEEYSFYIGG